MLFMFSVVKITVIDFEFGKDSLPLSIGQKRTIEIPNLPKGVRNFISVFPIYHQTHFSCRVTLLDAYYKF